MTARLSAEARQEITGPLNSDGLPTGAARLVDLAGDTQFACGEWSDEEIGCGEFGSSYEQLHRKARAAERALTAYVASLVAEIRALWAEREALDGITPVTLRALLNDIADTTYSAEAVVHRNRGVFRALDAVAERNASRHGPARDAQPHRFEGTP